MKAAIPKLPMITSFPGIGGPFGRMFLLSLLCHVAVFLPFLASRTGVARNPVVAYMDLNMAYDAKPAPVKTAPAEKEVTPPQPATVKAKPSSELDKLRENSRKALDGAAAQPETVQKESLGLGMMNGYFAGIGEGDTLRDDIRDYYFEILHRINEKWWLNRETTAKGRKDAVFYLVIARDGRIVDKMLVESSGNPACDRAMLQALEASSPLPPLPETYRGDFFQAPLRFNMPLNLLG
ncbi:MAG TPA: cell envelope integrity protein TolA [Geobacteraceae bacterium]|nr:cell envelope integrity protein TolA [Geobacteraceae bacterium]